ncbi:MAG: formylglycine-generating enzyme family protein [Verrucomicrobia bacterium]|nr:formylglycine-generating enzyme family protein [Verrucomicrobiota bacterium]
MKTSHLFSALVSAWLALVMAAPASPLSVSQGRASQRAGTRLVDVYYDIGGGTPPYTVTLQGSLDGGTTWTLPVTTVSGNVGAGVTAGTNRLVTWNAGTDWAGQLSTNVRFRVNASDTPPTPTGFALIPAGSFSMGDSVDGEYVPVHSVYVSAFFMEKYLVTKALWDSVRTWGLTHGYTDLPAGGGKATNHPVHSINWYAMVKWCNARSEKEGLTPCYTVSGLVYRTGSSAPVCNWSANGYRLPTEAEWEKAARGGVAGARYPWGTNTISQSQANYNASGTSYGNLSGDVGYHPTYNDGVFPYTSPVGSFAANGYGLYDMAGNVWEWCWDWYGSYTAGSQTDPRGPSPGSVRVVRGGGWYGLAGLCRVALRYFGYPDYSGSSMGFRAARSSVP